MRQSLYTFALTLTLTLTLTQVRQSLYTFADCVGPPTPKAQAAADEI